MHPLHLSKKDRFVSGVIELTGSKSISNRVLIIRALSGQSFPIERLAAANDTELMQYLLESTDPIRDAGPAGTTFRFLTAYLALQPGEQVLTGSARMKQRPIGVLVDALRHLGANIGYLENTGFPPLKIGEWHTQQNHTLTIAANTSSQYISALLLIAPTLPMGLELHLDGHIVSRPYIEMTLSLMHYFGVKHTWRGNTILVPPQPYLANPFVVEADWSAASYYYSISAIAEQADIYLGGLFAGSLQGDSVLVEMMEKFGIISNFDGKGVHLTKSGTRRPHFFEWDFLRCPDLAQTLAVTCAAIGVPSSFCGLETLSIKETDRIAALQNELQKINVVLSKGNLKAGQQWYHLAGQGRWTKEPSFATYEDHRMAMAFAPLAILGSISIEEPDVVKKSYPDFWHDLGQLGFAVSYS